ncbi:thiamine pyrophosphate-binding protein [Halopiger xanaduensis]|uniref:Acetolactate synthase n=1 Tax=Halopiger xanaduensis (strain DSM 18323 / JCM 14033 / SH-6) TaxID=797210 RepID=F8DDA9_HALXS|nr:thiamine pyrophosphate-binding protein [Halopiger xanaduensis]AEH38998.1 Acetolactate synthase [Halopiger xanaduensis SH-6]
MTAQDDPSGRARPGSEQLYDALVDAGIDLLVGLPGTQTLPLDRTVERRDDIRYVMARHETAIPHVAWGYYEAGGGVAATLTVPGPGDTNAMHGLKNALEDRVPIVHIAADADPADRGKGPIHEIEPDTFDNVVKENVSVERPLEFHRAVRSGIETALTPPRGPVRLGVPKSLLEGEFRSPRVTVDPPASQFEGDAEYRTAARLLAEADRPVVYLGVGARRTCDPVAVRDLVERLNAPVVASYKGKGVFPEDDPRWLGVTGSHLPAGARRTLEAADVVLALGARFDGVTTDDWSIPFGETLVHASADSAWIDNTYESDVAIVDDAGTAVEWIRDGLESESAAANAGNGWDGREIGDRVQSEYEARLRDRGLLADDEPIATAGVLRTLREALPRESIVTTDIGGFRLWAKQNFAAYEPEGYISAGSWAGMGVGVPAAIGAAFAQPDRPVVALTGDGGAMMCLQELHTAAADDLDVLAICFNNADYGIISKSPEIDRYTEGHRFDWSSPDFPAIAEGFGCRGETVRTLEGLEEAVDEALSRNGPELIDVRVDQDEPTAGAAAEYDSELPIRDG